MPELPEVETVRRGLAPILIGQTLARIDQRRPDLRRPFPERFCERLLGRTVAAVGRRAKYLLVHLSDGTVLVIHLGMSGRLRVDSASPKLQDIQANQPRVGSLGDFIHGPAPNNQHDHVVFTLGGGTTVTFNDPRRFGLMDLVAERDLDRHPLFAGLGPEPLDADFDAACLARSASARACDLKAFLMDQRVVAGLGNIYVAEALHYAGLSPHRSVHCLVKVNGTPTLRAERLVAAIRYVLGEAITAGGSTLRDHRQTDGQTGAFQDRFAVYGRTGLPCLRPGCRGTVSKAIQAGRATFFCHACQK